MNTTKYLQTDSRWSQLPYPKKPCRLGVCGCGELAINNVIIEMEQYKNYTPHTINDYCKQFAEARCNGTYHSGIPTMMKHYGLTEVKEHATMDSLWKELAKGDRVAIYLMGSRSGGSKKVHWTSSGHFICSVEYRYKDNDHQVYVKDSASDSSNRNGWCGYKTHLKGDVSKVWSGKLNGAKPSPTPTPTPPTPVGKLTVDGIGGTQTVKRMQEFFGTPVDGYIGGQLTKFKALYPALTAVNFGKGGSQCIIKLQKWLGLSDPDGIIGKNTTNAWQRKLRDLGYLAKNESIDGVIGVKSMKAWQECLNNDGKPKEEPSPTPTPTPDPKPTPTPQADKYKVIDVSEFQKTIDWAKVKADGVVGAIIRYGDGTYLDPNFDTNMKNAKANGLHIGAYIFSRAKTKAQAESEATRLFNACKPYSPDLPLYIDLEAKGLEKYAETVAQAFVSKIKAFGGKPGVYANLNWWNNYLTKTAKGSFAMWLAQYNKTMDYKPKSYVGMWQYSSSGKVSGIKGNVDMDWLYQRYWDNEPAPEPTPTPTPTKNKLVTKCDEYAWAYGTDPSKYAYKTGSARATYKTALKKYMGKSAKVSQTDCGYFVSTCVRASGLGDKFLALPGKPTDKYPSVPSTMQIVHKGKKIPDGFLKAGDIIRYRKKSGQHTMIYYGDGKIAEAQRSSATTGKNYPAIKKDTKKYNASNVKYSTIQVIRAK